MSNFYNDATDNHNINFLREVDKRLDAERERQRKAASGGSGGGGTNNNYKLTTQPTKPKTKTQERKYTSA